MEMIKRFRPLTWLAIGFVKAWRRLLSPLYGDVCKYYPTCSAYGLRALQVHGVFRATPLIVWRILRCNPWSDGGYDPVPGTPEAREALERADWRSGREQAADRSGDAMSSSGGEDAQWDTVRADAGQHRPVSPESSGFPGPATVPESGDSDDAADRTAALNHSRTSRSGKYPHVGEGSPCAVYAH